MLIKKSFFFIIFFILFVLTSNVEAAFKFWVAANDGTTKYWNDNANWADSKNGTAGASYPRVQHKVRFNARSTVDVTLRADAEARRLQIFDTYTGTVNLAGFDMYSKQGVKIWGGTFEVPSGSTLRTAKWNSVIGTQATVNAENGSLFFGKGLEIEGTLNAPSGNLTVRGNWANSGTFNHNSGTVIFNPRLNGHTITPGGTGSTKAFYNVKKIYKKNILLAGAISLNNFEIALRGGLWKAQGNAMSVAGNWKVNDQSAFTHGNNTVSFSGSNSQEINVYPNKGDFYSLNISNTAATVSVNSHAIEIDNTLTIDSNATLDIEGQNLTSATLTNNGNLQLQGGETVAITTMDTNSGTVTYDGTGTYTQLAAGDAYYNLTLNSSGSITLDANLNVDGGLTITDGTLDVSSNNRSVNVAGNWSNSDTFISRSGTVTFDGSSTVTSGGITTNTKDFYDVILSGSATQSTNAIDIDGDFTISSSGTWDTSNLCMYVAGTTTIGSGTLTNAAATLSSSSPADGATGVSSTANIVLTFSEAVDVESGNILIKKTSDDSTIETIDVTGSKVTGTGTTVITINPSATLASETGYYLTIAATAFDDCSSKSYAGITSKTALNFTTAVGDPPTLSSSLPADGATGVSATANIVLTFSEAVDVESGNITLYKSDGTQVEAIAVTNSKITGTGTDTITINPSTTLASAASYYLNIAATAFDDSSSNSYAGITDATTLNFTTANTGCTVNGVAETGQISLARLKIAIATGTDDVTTCDVSAITDMSRLFYLKTTFNQDISAWNPVSVTDMSEMFHYATSFNRDISGWNTGAVTDMSSMFRNSIAFNNGGVALDWSDTSEVTDMSYMFYNSGADVFNQDISAWDVSKVTDMSYMFYKTDVFNQDISDWVTGTVTNMQGMFYDAEAFNNGGDTLDWSDTSKVTTMNQMFRDADTFNQDISGWNTGAVTNMNSMFHSADTFNQDVSAWDVRKVTNMSYMFLGDTLSTANYDALLIAWDALELWDDVAFHGGSSKYTTCSAASAAREKMIATDGDSWTITDGGAIPTMTITAVEVFDGATSNDATLSLTFTSCEETADFVVGDITVTGGSLSSFTASSSTVYTATFTPTTEGATTIDVQAAAFTSTYGSNENTAATQFNWTYSTTASDDTTAPTITFSPADSDTGVAVTSNITLTFNEAIRNTNDSGLTSDTIGSLITLKNTNSSGSDINFVATIDTALKVITINPNSDFSSEQVVYVAIGATVEDFFDNAISASSATFTAADSTAPTLVFDPEDLESAVPVADNITLTFNEVIRNTNNSSLTDSNVDSLITLKDSDASGSDIAFNATIDTDNKVITINPDSSFSSEQVVYVAIGATVEDASDNAISASSITFNAADSTAPNVDFTPVNSATGIAVNSEITIAFDEVIRNTDNSSLTDATVDSLITLKTTNSSGTDIDFEAVIDDSKKLITISPSSDFSSEQVIYVAIGATVEDASDNAISASSITFTAADATAPTVAFVPPDATSCVPISSNVSLTFSEAVRNPDDSDISDNVGDIITLEYTSDSSPIAFTATINSAKTVITINPDSNFVSGEVIGVAIESVEDTSNNTMSATSGTFCVVDSTAPTIEFSPADQSKKVAEDTDITLTFDEEIRLIDNSAIDNTNVDSLITLKTTNSSGADIAFDAIIDSDKKVITISLVSNLSSNQAVYVRIGETVEDSYNNAISEASAIFTSGDRLPPTVNIQAVKASST